MRVFARRPKNPAGCLRELALALGIAFVSYLFLGFWRILSVLTSKEQILQLLIRIRWPYLLAIFIPAYLIVRLDRSFRARILELAFRYRWLIGLAFVFICVALNLNGSSLHCLTSYYHSDANGVLLGKPRIWRGDEFALNTAFAFSQAASGFQYYSPVIRGGADAFIIYGQPVLDIAAIFRPFHWGYLLLGAERGLSFFFSARLAVLFLMTFDFSLLLLNKRRGLSLMLTLMVVFSPFTQWWFAINALVEMFIFGFAAVLLLNRYFMTESFRLRLLFGALAGWLGTAYVLTFYPAWMVPVAYILLVFIVWVFCLHAGKGRLKPRDLWALAAALCVMAAGLGYVYFKSKETIQLTLHTIYPGTDRGSNPVPFIRLFSDISGLFTTMKGGLSGLIGNEVEASGVIAFFPAGILLFAYQSIRRKRVDLLSGMLMLLTAVFLSYTLLGWPAWLSKLLLLSFTYEHRVMPLLMLLQLFVLFREISLADQAAPLPIGGLAAALVTGLTLVFAHQCYPAYLNLETLAMAAVIVFVAVTASFCMEGRPWLRRAFAVCVTVCAVCGGLLVNPVQRGAEEMVHNEITDLVEPIVRSDPDALWVVEEEYPLTNAPIVVAARTINSSNVYPNMALWHRIDPDGRYEAVYNRYAHIALEITEDETEFLPGIAADLFTLKINAHDLDVIGAEYILTRHDLTLFDSEDYTFEYVDGGAEFIVYRLVRNEE